jgi:hypothetical protein
LTTWRNSSPATSGRRSTTLRRTLLRQLKAEDHPDLRGEMEYVDSPRHTNYVEVHQYMHVLDELRDRLGWSAPSESSYENLRRASIARA